MGTGIRVDECSSLIRVHGWITGKATCITRDHLPAPLDKAGTSRFHHPIRLPCCPAYYVQCSCKDFSAPLRHTLPCDKAQARLRSTSGLIGLNAPPSKIPHTGLADDVFNVERLAPVTSVTQADMPRHDTGRPRRCASLVRLQHDIAGVSAIEHSSEAKEGSGSHPLVCQISCRKSWTTTQDPSVTSLYLDVEG
jgi:hypothetical protein